jgi:hypothetical protein
MRALYIAQDDEGAPGRGNMFTESASYNIPLEGEGEGEDEGGIG